MSVILTIMTTVTEAPGSGMQQLNGHGEADDQVHNMDGAWQSKTRKITDHDMMGPVRQRKISHRKVIIHDDGEICNKTYNKVWRSQQS